MKKIIIGNKVINLHSIVDVITNSSTVVYVWPTGNAIEMATNTLQSMMNLMGVEGNVEDYWDISVVADPSWAEDQRYNWACDYNLPDDFTEEDIDEDDLDDYHDLLTRIESGEDSDGWSHKCLRIISKKDDTFDLAGKFLNLFEMDGVYS